jgi:hypothetical protein
LLGGPKIRESCRWIKLLRKKRIILGNGNGNEKENGNENEIENGNENENENENDIDMHCVIEHHNTQYAPVDTTNRDNERRQPKRQHNGVRDAKVPKRQNNGERDATVLVGHGGGG